MCTVAYYYQKKLSLAEDRLSARKSQRIATAKDKISRFIRGALGEELDYVEEKVTKDVGPLELLTDSEGNVDFERTADYLEGRDRFKRMYQARTDIFRLGLGLDQRYDSMVASKYRPTGAELEQITTKGAPAFVGQEGWKLDRPLWDFRDQDFYGVEQYSKDSSTRPSRNLGTILGDYGEFWSQDMRRDDSEVPEGGDYGAFSDVWDFKMLEKK